MRREKKASSSPLPPPLSAASGSTGRSRTPSSFTRASSSGAIPNHRHLREDSVDFSKLRKNIVFTKRELHRRCRRCRPYGFAAASGAALLGVVLLLFLVWRRSGEEFDTMMPPSKKLKESTKHGVPKSPAVSGIPGQGTAWATRKSGVVGLLVGPPPPAGEIPVREEGAELGPTLPLLEEPMSITWFYFPGPPPPTKDVLTEGQFVSPIFFHGRNTSKGWEERVSHFSMPSKKASGWSREKYSREKGWGDAMLGDYWKEAVRESLYKWRRLREVHWADAVVGEEDEEEEEEVLITSLVEDEDEEHQFSSSSSSSLPSRRLLSFISWSSSVQEDLLVSSAPHDRLYIYRVHHLRGVHSHPSGREPSTGKPTDALEEKELAEAALETESGQMGTPPRPFALNRIWTSPSIHQVNMLSRSSLNERESHAFIVSAIAGDLLGNGHVDILLQDSNGQLYMIPNSRATPSSFRGKRLHGGDEGIYSVRVTPSIPSSSEGDNADAKKPSITLDFKDPLQPMITAAGLLVTPLSGRAANLLYVNTEGELVVLTLHGVDVVEDNIAQDHRQKVFYYNASVLVPGVVRGHREVLPYSVLQADVNRDCVAELLYAIRDVRKKTLDIYAILAPPMDQTPADSKARRNTEEETSAESVPREVHSERGKMEERFGYFTYSGASASSKAKWIAPAAGETHPQGLPSPVAHRLLLSLDESRVLYGHMTMADVDGDGLVDLLLPYCSQDKAMRSRDDGALPFCQSLDGVRVWYNTAAPATDPASSCWPSHRHRFPNIDKRRRSSAVNSRVSETDAEEVTHPATAATHGNTEEHMNTDFGFRDEVSAAFPINAATCGMWSKRERDWPMNDDTESGQEETASAPEVFLPQLLRTGDFNRDGRTDILLASNVGPLLLAASSLGRTVNVVDPSQQSSYRVEDLSRIAAAALPFTCTPVDSEKSLLLYKYAKAKRRMQKDFLADSTSKTRNAATLSLLEAYRDATPFFVGGAQPGELYIGLTSLRLPRSIVKGKERGETLGCRWLSLYEPTEYLHEHYYMLLSAVVQGDEGASRAGDTPLRRDGSSSSLSSSFYYGAPAFGVVHHLYWNNKDMLPMEVFTTQLPRANGYALAPFQVLVGLGQTFSYAHRYMVGRRWFSFDALSVESEADSDAHEAVLLFTREWPNFLVPNSQVFALLNRKDHPQDQEEAEGRLALYMPVQKYRRRLFTTLLISLTLIGVPVMYLMWRELTQDELEWRNR